MTKFIISLAFLANLASCNPSVWSHFVENEASALETLISEEAQDLEAGLAVPKRPSVELIPRNAF